MNFPWYGSTMPGFQLDPTPERENTEPAMLPRTSIKERFARTAVRLGHPATLCKTGLRAATLAVVGLVLKLSTPALAHEGVEHDIVEATEKLDRQPNDVAALVHRGHLYRIAGKYQLSLADLNRARALAPRDLPMLLQRGLTLSALQRDDAAEVELLTYVKLGGDSPRALTELGHLQARTERAELAVQSYRHSLALQPDVDVYLALGAVLESVGQLQAATKNYRTGLEKTGAELLLRALVTTEVALGHHAEALILIEAEIQKSQARAEWRLERAQILTALGRVEEARAERKRAVQEATRVVQGRGTAMDFVVRARAYLALGYRDAARRDLTRALSKVPNFAPAQELLKAVSPAPD